MTGDIGALTVVIAALTTGEIHIFCAINMNTQPNNGQTGIDRGRMALVTLNIFLDNMLLVPA